MKFVTKTKNNYGTGCLELVDRALDHYELPDSPSAVRLLCMTAAHESGQYRYCRQIKGPALGIFQMEPATFDTVLGYVLRKEEKYSILADDARRFNPEDMIFNPVFAAGMARAFYLRIPDALPDPQDVEGLSGYAKDYWNTPLGKATPEDYYDAFMRDFS